MTNFQSGDIEKMANIKLLYYVALILNTGVPRDYKSRIFFLLLLP